KGCGGSEQQAASDSATEIKDPVVVAWRPSDEHVLQHLLGYPGGAAVPDEVGSEFSVSRPSKGHVVAQDLHLFSILDYGCQRVVRRRGFHLIAQFNVRKLLAPDDPLLRFC